MNKEGDKNELEILLETQQNKFLQILEKRDREHEKTIRTFFICVSIVITVWIIGAFLINVIDINEKRKNEVSENVRMDKKDIIPICDSNI